MLTNSSDGVEFCGVVWCVMCREGKACIITSWKVE